MRQPGQVLALLLAVFCSVGPAFAGTDDPRLREAVEHCQSQLVDDQPLPAPAQPGLVQRALDAVRAGLGQGRERIFRGRHYYLIELEDDYRGEAREGVVYYDESDRPYLRIAVRENGLLYDGRGRKLDGAYIFIMDREGQIYASRQNVGLIHHSSLAAGRAVAAAGELLAMDGRLLAMNNKSGHYTPPLWLTRQAFERLAQLGADLSRAGLTGSW